MTEFYLEKQGALGIVRIVSGDGRNVLNDLAAGRLLDILELVEADEEVRVLMLSSGAPGVFAISGERREEAAEVAIPYAPERDAWSRLAGLSKPTVVAISGLAAGAGLELALACDVRVASSDAVFEFSEVRAGSIPHHGGTQRLPRIVGKAKALEMILLGQKLDADEALRCHLVNKVVPLDGLVDAAREYAMMLAGNGPIALRYARDAVANGVEMTFDQGLHLEMDLYALLQTTRDRAEGLQAYREKRKPSFEGR